MTEAMYKLYGALGSPYSIKMRALLRYRRIPFIWVQGAQAHALAQTMKAPVIPVLEYPDGARHNDSTPLIYALEARHPNGRSVMPDDPADAFLARLIEDFADEWVTKAMFAYRWLRLRDQERMSTWLSFDAGAGGGRETFEARAKWFRERQVGRMALVGCTQENAPLIETTTRALLAALEAHVVNTLFLFGSRPSLAEFGLYGQLSQLGTDPTASEMYRADYPYAFRWLAHMDDLSGVEGEWRTPGPAPDVVRAILEIVGAVYLPFLIANDAALKRGDAEMQMEALGLPYTQAPFKYQVKCLSELRRAYADLPAAAKESLSPLLTATHCLAPLQSAG